MANPGRRIPIQRQPWHPGRCADCHRKPGKRWPYLRRGLCMACYQQRRRLGLAMPPKMGTVIYRPKVRRVRSVLRSAWDATRPGSR